MSACALVCSRPQNTLVTSTTAPSTTTPRLVGDSFEDLHGKEQDVEDDQLIPIISQFRVRSDIQYRYARTVVESYVKNPSNTAKEITFHMVMPKKAFVSNFSMLIGDEEFVAKVQEKAEAKETYDEAVSAGQSAGIVNQDVREANKIVVTTNIESQGKVRFTMTYEELLQRKLGRYEHIVHVNPGQIVEDFVINVYINESLPVQSIRVPEMKTDPNAITSSNENRNAKVEKDLQDSSKVHIQYKPSTDLQKEESKSGLAGQFIVQYDVDRKNESSDIQVIDGYFVHFFTPDKLETLPKHVIFVLDLSGSMSGRKLEQTKDAMVTILDDMTEQDSFNILTFSDHVYHWKSENEKLKEGPHSLTYPGTEEIRNEALNYVLDLSTIGGTNINDGLLEGIKLAKDVRIAEVLAENVKPLIVFLTDGEATSGVTSPEQILKNVRDANDLDVPIYGLAFGRGADFGLIKKVSETTNGLARKIYEGSDAAIQLEDFYQGIANPLLSDVKFDYVGELAKNVTKTSMDTFNKGGEFVIAGKIDNPTETEDLTIEVQGSGANGVFNKRIDICFRRPGPIPEPIPLPLPVENGGFLIADPVINDNDRPWPIRPWPCYPIPEPKPEEPQSETQNFIERLWAFTTINNLLEEQVKQDDESNEVPLDAEDEEVDDVFEEDDDDFEEPILALNFTKPKEESPKEKALKLALKYNFVTPITSLVVTRPAKKDSNETIEAVPVDLVAAEASGRRSGLGSGFRMRTVAFSASPSGFGGNLFSIRAGAGPGLPGVFKRKKTASKISSPLAGPSAHNRSPLLSGTMMDYDDDTFTSTTNVAHNPNGSPTTTTTTTTTTTPKTRCSGSITMFAETYRRGFNVTIADDEQDLDTRNFLKKLTSLEVEGDCCWEVYTESNFAGKMLQFTEGNYDSASKMKFLFRKAASVKRLLECN